MRHRYECPVRWADLDLQGHVNNVVYVDYLQEARVDMLRVHARSPQTQGLAEGVVVVGHRVTYLAPLHFDFAPVYVETWVTEIKAATFTLGYEIFRESAGERTVYVRATTVLSPYVFATETPRRLSPEERANLGPYLEPGEPVAFESGEPRVAEASRYELQVRFSDVDAYGHVNNVKYYEYFQEARVAFLRDLVHRSGGERPRVVIAQSDVRYLRPMFHRPEPYDVRTRPVRLGSRSLTVEAGLYDGPELLARGRQVVVFVDETGVSTTPTAPLRAAIEALL